MVQLLERTRNLFNQVNCSRDGWHLRADGRTCRDIDECSGGARVCGGGVCRNTPGSYMCTCGEGLLPSPDDTKPTCLDIDECSDVSIH